IEVLTQGFTISYVPSATFLARLSGNHPVSVEGLLALGDPVFPGEPSDSGSKAASSLPSGGLFMMQVFPDGAAAKARLRTGDVLVRYADVPLDSVEQFRKEVQSHTGTDEVALTVWREGLEELFTVRVPPGKLGVAFSTGPAREAIASRRQNE